MSLPGSNLTDTAAAAMTSVESVVAAVDIEWWADSLQDLHYGIGLTSVLLCAVGLTGNTLTLIALLQADMRSTTYTFLTGLAVADITVIITGTLLMCLSSTLDTETDVLVDDKYLPNIYPLLRPACLTCVCVSIWITVALTLDRYLAVCHHGMRIQTWFTIPRARIVTVVIFVVASLYNIPTFFEYRIDSVYEARLNQTVAVYVPTAMGSHVVYRQIYHSWLVVPLFWAIPFVCLLYMNTRLILVVGETRLRSKQLGQAVPGSVDVTVMLIAIIMLFFTCQTPHLVTVIVWAVKPEQFTKIAWMKFYLITVLLVLANSSLNFVIYALFGKRLLRKFKQIVCQCLCRPGSQMGLAHSVKTDPSISQEMMPMT